MEFTNSGGYLNYSAITSMCFTIVQPPFQPTIVTSLTMSPSNTININETSEILVNIQTKGQIVNQAQIVYYQNGNILNSPTSNVLSNCNQPTYSYSTLVSDILCVIPIVGLLGVEIYPYLQLTVQGVVQTVYNYQLQESGYPSFISVQGPPDNGLVPNITYFETSFNWTTNTITINYNIDNQCPYAVMNIIQFVIFNKQMPTMPFGPGTDLTVTQSQSSGTFSIDLCNLPGFAFWYQDIGIYINIPSYFPNDKSYQFPYIYLIEMDPNNQSFPINPLGCDFSGPRLVNVGILNPQSVYDTTNQGYSVTLFYDITDDLTGFNNLLGSIKLKEGANEETGEFYIQPIQFNASALVSGNIRNGRYQFTIQIPQYTNGTYEFSISNITDNQGNSRPFTYQNILIINGGTPLTINAYSSEPSPTLPVLTGVTVTGTNPELLSITISTNGEASSAYILPIGLNLSGYVYASPILNSSQFQITRIDPIGLNTGTYYFAVCLNSNSLKTICYSPFDLQSMNFANSFPNYSPVYYPPPSVTNQFS